MSGTVLTACGLVMMGAAVVGGVVTAILLRSRGKALRETLTAEYGEAKQEQVGG